MNVNHRGTNQVYAVVSDMVLFRQQSDEPSGAVPRLLRVSPLRHSFRVSTSAADDLAYSSDADSSISVPDFGSQDLDGDKKGKHYSVIYL